MTGERFLFIQGCYQGRPLTPELTEAQLRKAESAVLVGGGATKSYFRAWDEHNIAVLPHPGSLQPHSPLPHSSWGSPDLAAMVLRGHSRKKHL